MNGSNSGRREFLRSVLSGAAGLVAARTARAATSRIDILLNEPIGTIAPEIYGHFIEHLGGVVYDGVWVGEKSKVPNIQGIRKELVDRMQEIKPAVIRWPGGCFADSYNWRDGVGPRAQRPRRTNFWYGEVEGNGPQKYDPNEFGTNEFAHFTQLVKSQPYLAANLRSLPAHDFYEWVEYCNSPSGSTSLANLRGTEPFQVRYWGVGNESWGCGGNFTGEEYAVEFRRFTAWVPQYGNEKLRYIASGPNGGDLKWTNGLFEKLTEKGHSALEHIYGLALHYYCGTTAGGAVEYNVDEWYELLGKANYMEQLINKHWSAMCAVDTDHRVKLIVDEWGAWHEKGPIVDPSYPWSQTPALRDALVSAITLDTFNRHADKIAMANAAQLINTIHCLFLAKEDKFTVTPNYHVFAMYVPHQGAQSVRAVFSADAVPFKSEKISGTVPGLAGSASVKGKDLTLTVANTHPSESRDTEISLQGAEIAGGEAVTLSGELHAHNTFENPNALTPKTASVSLRGRTAGYTFPAASVTCLRLKLV
jgi:alpha-N-arabinofuranosidase